MAPIVAMLAATSGAAARLTDVSITPGVVTITADTPPSTAFAFALAAPYRLVVDLPGVSTASLTIAGVGSVRGLRAAMFTPAIARLVMDLDRPLEIVSASSDAGSMTLTLRRTTDASFAAAVARGRRPLPVMSGGPTPDTAGGASQPAAMATESGGFDLPGDMFALPGIDRTLPSVSAPGSGDAAAGPAVASAPTFTAPPPPGGDVVRRSLRSRSGGKPLVVIDAGHGGKDAGAISVGGGFEKDVTLAIAKATARSLERGGKVRVRLTRSNDRFIPLAGRVAIARTARADLFISIHADAAANAEARGASVYTLSAVASDAVAARLAARENKADIISGVNLGVEAPEVGDIMIDLSRRATGNVSVAFAETLQATLSDRMRFRGQFHHFAGFRVLKAPDVPSVLLETGYVTNAQDAEFLFSANGRRRIADGIARAIERHLAGD